MIGGSALGFDWANHHRERLRGIVFMETIVRPLSWADWPESSRRVFQGFRSAAGEEMILEKNMFVERVLPASILRRLEPAEMDEYRRPFASSKDDRWPTLSWPREIPVEGAPASVVKLVTAYAGWMAENDVPKLFVNANPGAILVGAQREFCRQWRNQTEVTVVAVTSSKKIPVRKLAAPSRPGSLRTL
jgi:haloalkane dehalogenase